MLEVAETTLTSITLADAVIALGAPAAATAVLAAAVFEAPPAAPVPRIGVGLAATWAVVFGVAASRASDIAVAAALIAAVELAAATAIWFGRSRLGRPDWGSDGGWGTADPGGPRGPSVPDSYWEYWESDMAAGPQTVRASRHDEA